VDHLEASGKKEIEMLAKSEVIPVALPGASMGLGEAFAPARKLLDAGASLAIASDWNPGSAPMGNLLVQAAVLGAMKNCRSQKPWQELRLGAAAALGLDDRGRLDEGYWADLAVFPTSDYREIFYRQGQLLPATVWKKGERIF
jgi:imidazolonepropionase